MACWICPDCRHKNCDTDVCLNRRCPSLIHYDRDQVTKKLHAIGETEIDTVLATLPMVTSRLYDNFHVDAYIEFAKGESSCPTE